MKACKKCIAIKLAIPLHLYTSNNQALMEVFQTYAIELA
jgi:hypothetical protein